jgi:hypothetical protein
MNNRKLVFIFLVVAPFVALAGALTPQPVRAQTCHGPTGAPIPCPDKKKTPTDIPPSGTPTFTATIVFQPQSTGQGGTLIPMSDTPTPTLPSWEQTDIAICWRGTYDSAMATLFAKTPAYNNNDWATADFSGDQCIQTREPAPTATKFIPAPIEGPVFLRPGVVNVLILVMIIGVLFTGGVLIARLGKK